MGNTSGGQRRKSVSLDEETFCRVPPLDDNPISDDPVFSILTDGIATNAIADRLRGAAGGGGGGGPAGGQCSADPALLPTLSDSETCKVPTFFKWEGGGKEVYLSGSFTGWKSKIPMTRSSSKSNFYIMLDLPVGEYQYKFIVDGQWKVDQKQRISTGPSELASNVVEVRQSDQYFVNALLHDMTSTTRPQGDDPANPQQPTATSSSDVIPCQQGSSPSPPMDMCADEIASGSPPGSYSTDIPRYASAKRTTSGGETDDLHDDHIGPPSPPAQKNKSSDTPPSLPPQLNQAILNRDTASSCDPNLLPQPGHTMLNHMYALSITDGVIILGATTRYRQKYVSTVVYKPI